MTKKQSRYYAKIKGVEYVIVVEKDKWQMFVPQVNENTFASGLHHIEDNQDNTHYDFYMGKEKLNTKEYVKQKIGGIAIIPEKDDFVILPPGKFIWPKRDSKYLYEIE